MGTCQAHNLSSLSENDCWLLFKQYAFGHYREEQAELVAIGKEIVKKCGGLPLAAQALGGLMRSRSEEKEWLEIKESRLWTLPDENSILPALRLSYLYLTPTLKQCFAFCAIFPKDTKIMKQDLIHLWMANGFISSRVNLEVEDVGNMIWNELCQKSFFQDLKMDDYSGDISFKMHDLVHDLAQSVMGSECMVLENTTTDLSRSTHHIAFDSDNMSISFNEVNFKKIESLRTLYQLSLNFLDTTVSFSTKCSLRVLRIRTLNLSSLESLIHLRYLELYNFRIETLPDSICSLQKLEILKLKNCARLSFLPKHLTCLQNLRHFIIEGVHALSHVFPYIGKLSCLRTLSLYIVESEPGHSLAELRNLNLGGKLSIEGLKNVGSLSEAREANLIGKKGLQKLCLSWRQSGETKIPSTSPEQVLEVLQPHSDLKGLEIYDYDGLCFPNWIGILSSLVALELWGCKNCVRLSPLGKLPSLKKLQLRDIYNVQYIDDDDDESHDGVEVRTFPSLEELTLIELPNLEGLLKVEKEEMFLRLSNLTIRNCPKLGLPSLPSIKYLSLDGCNNDLLRSISCYYGLTTLQLSRGEEMTSLPEGMLRNLTYLKFLTVADFPKLKELQNEPFNRALERLHGCQAFHLLNTSL